MLLHPKTCPRHISPQTTEEITFCIRWHCDYFYYSQTYYILNNNWKHSQCKASSFNTKALFSLCKTQFLISFLGFLEWNMRSVISEVWWVSWSLMHRHLYYAGVYAAAMHQSWFSEVPMLKIWYSFSSLFFYDINQVMLMFVII